MTELNLKMNFETLVRESDFESQLEPAVIEVMEMVYHLGAHQTFLSMSEIDVKNKEGAFKIILNLKTQLDLFFNKQLSIYLAEERRRNNI